MAGAFATARQVIEWENVNIPGMFLNNKDQLICLISGEVYVTDIPIYVRFEAMRAVLDEILWKTQVVISRLELKARYLLAESVNLQKQS